MKRISLALLAVMILGLAGLMPSAWPASNSPEDNAQILYTEACALIQSGEKAEVTSYAEALKFYEQALSRLERIQAVYPETQAALKLQSGELKIKNSLFEDFKSDFVPAVRHKAEAESHNLACATYVADSIKAPYLKAYGLNEIASNYARQGMVTDALKLLTQVTGLAPAITNSGEKASVLRDAAITYALAQQYATALNLASSIANPGDKIKAQVHIARSYAKAGDNPKANALLETSLATARAIPNLKDRNDSLADIAKAYAEIRNFKPAIKTAEHIVKLEVKADAMVEIARAYAKASFFKQAMQMVTSMEASFKVSQSYARSAASYFEGSALRYIARFYAEAGKFPEAFNVTNRIIDHSFKTKALRDIAGVYLNAGKTREALDTLQAGVKNANLIEDPYLRCSAKNDLAKSFSAAGKPATGLKLLHQALNLADKIETPYFKTLALCALAVSYTKAQQKDLPLNLLTRSLQLVERINNSYLKNVATKVAAKSFIETKLYQEALQAADKMTDPVTRNLFLIQAAIATEEPDSGAKAMLHQIVQKV